MSGRSIDKIDNADGAAILSIQQVPTLQTDNVDISKNEEIRSTDEASFSLLSTTNVNSIAARKDVDERDASAPMEPTPFSCRRWYRLTGKSIKPDDVLTHILPTMRLPPSTAPVRPRKQTTRAWGPFASQSQHDGLFQARPSTYQGIPLLESPMKWQSIGQWDPSTRKHLATSVYTKSNRSLTMKNRKAQAKDMMRDHIYLPAVHKTLSMFHSPRVNATANPLPQKPTNSDNDKANATPFARTMPAVPVGCNLLSTQLHALLQELAALEESHNENSILSGSSVWCPQPPPRAAPSASYRSARSFVKPQRAKESTSQDLTADESAKITRHESAEYGIFTDLEEAGMKSSTSSLETQILRLLEGCDSENANSEQHQFSNGLNEIGGDFRSDYDPDFISDDDELTLLRAYQTSDSCSEHDITSITSSGEYSENSLPPPSTGEKQFSTGHDEGTEWELGCNASDGSEEVDATGIDAVHSPEPSDDSDAGFKDEVGLQDRATHSTSAKACEVEGDLNTCDFEENIVSLEAMEDLTITAPTSGNLDTSNSGTISNHPSSELRVVDEPSSSVEDDPISDVPISLNEDAMQQVIPDSSSILLSASCDDTATVIEDNMAKRLGAEEGHKLKDRSALASRYAEPTQAELFEPGTVGSNEASSIILTNQFFESADVELVDVIAHGDASTPADVCVDANNIVVASIVFISGDSSSPVFFNGGVMSSVNGEAEPDDLSGDSKLQPREFLENLESEMSATTIDSPFPLPLTLASDAISEKRSTPTSDEERAIDAILQTLGSSSRLDTEGAAMATEADGNGQVYLQVSEYEVNFEDGEDQEDQEDQELYEFEDE